MQRRRQKAAAGQEGSTGGSYIALSQSMHRPAAHLLHSSQISASDSLLRGAVGGHRALAGDQMGSGAVRPGENSPPSLWKAADWPLQGSRSTLIDGLSKRKLQRGSSANKRMGS